MVLNSEPVVETRDLSIGYLDEYDRVWWVVIGVNLRINEGETYCIVGESGCGKSTLGNALIGILPPYAETRGIIRIMGEEIVRDDKHYYWKSRGRIVSYIPQNPGKALHPFMTIHEQFKHLYRARGLRLDDRGVAEKASRILELVGLDPDEVLDSYPHELSGGMQQRAAIAMAVSTGAKIIVADEPTSSLDANLRLQILKLLRKIKEELGITLIMITHDLVQASKNCERIGVMYAGRIVEEAPVKEIFRNPQHPYTQLLLETVPVLGVVKELKTIPGEPPRPGEYPPGCPFHPRCPFRIDKCSREEPVLRKINGKHYVSCWLR